MKRLIVVFAVLTAVLLLPGAARSDGQFPFLESGFTQSLYATTSGFFGGVAFAPNGDPWVDNCSFGGSPLWRFDHATTAPQDGSNVHPQVAGSPVPSNAGCGLTNHPDGFLYSNTGSGVVQINASTGAPTGVQFGAAGDALGIAVDPQTRNLVYVGADGTILTAPVGGASSTYSSVTTGSFVDGIAFDPTGNFLFLSNRTLNVVTVISRSGALVRNSPTIDGVPDGISFHTTSPQFVVTNNNDGTMTRLDFPGNDYTAAPTLSLFASNGFRGDLTQVGADGCIYLTQDGTRFDDGTTSGDSSLVRICPGFAPPPGVGGTPLNPGTTVCNGDYNGTGKDVIVPAGAVCTLESGTHVTHDVTVQAGGTLLDEGAVIGHDLSATDPKGITVSGGSIGHDLMLDGLTGSPPSGGNFICATSVGHDLTVQNGAATAGPLDIGDPPDCAVGNQIGHNLVVQSNAEAVDVSENSAGHDTTCAQNGSLSAAGNHAGHANTCTSPVVTPSGDFYDLQGATIAGDTSYDLAVAADGTGITRVWLTQDGTQIATTATCTNNCPAHQSLATSVDTTQLSEATHDYAARAADAAGNVGESDWSVTVDRSAPDDQAGPGQPDDTVETAGTDDGLGGGSDGYDDQSDTDPACDAYVDFGVPDWCTDPGDTAAAAGSAARTVTAQDVQSTYTGCALEAVFWSVGSANRLIAALEDQNVGAACGDYYFATQSDRDPVCDTAIRGSWPGNFHAAPVFNWTLWAQWIGLSPGTRNWYQAGVNFRQAMDANGCRPGDRWFVNELPTAWHALFDSKGKPISSAMRQLMRARIADALRGLYNGGSSTNVQGFTADVVESESTPSVTSYKTGLEGGYGDTRFWQAVSRYVEGWSKEVYNRCTQTCVQKAASTIADQGVNPFSYHERFLAMAAPAADGAVKTALANTYMPLLNGIWKNPRPVYDSLISLPQMDRMIRQQIYSARRAAQFTYGSRGRIGFAWKESGFNTTDDDGFAKQLAANLARALHDAYQGNSPGAACVDNDGTGGTFYQGCPPAPRTGAAFNTVWNTLKTWP